MGHVVKNIYIYCTGKILWLGYHDDLTNGLVTIGFLFLRLFSIPSEMTRLPEKSWELLELTRMPGDAAEKVVPLALTCWHVIFLIPNSSPQKSSSPLMDTARGNEILGSDGVRFPWGWTCLGVGTWRTQACWMERLVSFSMGNSQKTLEKTSEWHRYSWFRFLWSNELLWCISFVANESWCTR